jgi:tetratricopeptide (TPR) repeat protein
MDEAEKLLQRALELDPEYTSASYSLAYAYFIQAFQGWAKDRLAALARARQINDKLVQRDAEFSPAYRLRARFEMLWDLPEYDPEAALGDARKSVELGPNDELNLWTLGYVLFFLRHFDEAAAAFATAIRLNPHPPTFLPGWHATALSAAGRHEQAIAEVEAAVAANPKNPQGPWFRGQVEAWAGRYAEPARSFERARELDPDSAQFAYLLAAAYDQLGRIDDAISLLEKGPSQWRSVPEIHLWLALSYALAGRKEQAATEFASLRALAPKFTVSIVRRDYSGYFELKFFDRIAALSREYGIPEK